MHFRIFDLVLRMEDILEKLRVPPLGGVGGGGGAGYCATLLNGKIIPLKIFKCFILLLFRLEHLNAADTNSRK